MLIERLRTAMLIERLRMTLAFNRVFICQYQALIQGWYPLSFPLIFSEQIHLNKTENICRVHKIINIELID